ncbi:autotransporter outer membrane beta-barrel domain-containing protein [Polynucleobacter paneuropaeus]|nr:autotransporter outer membrane beta-barrel domain-containing protein [Polynucleobacter paneuropaeus]
MLATNVLANGGAGGDVNNGGAGGVDSVSGTGGVGRNGSVSDGGGGGGAGLSAGGAGGAGAGGVGGAGGAGGASGGFPSGGVTNINISGSAGDVGSLSGDFSGSGGGGGGAGGYGIIVTNQSTLTNVINVTISGGAGGTGGIGTYGGGLVQAGGGGGGSGGIGIYLGSPNVVMSNFGTITGGAGGAGAFSYAPSGRGGGSGGAAVEVATGSSAVITNSGNLTGGAGGAGGGGAAGSAGLGILIDTGGSASISNSHGANITSGITADSISNLGTISALSNSGGISVAVGSNGVGNGINNSGTITTLINQVGGIINASNGNAAILNTGTIGTLTNLWVMNNGSGPTILNNGTISVFNNVQNQVNTNSSVVFSGKLPTNYNIIVTNATLYGKLVLQNVTGTTVFGISSLSPGKSAVSTTAYTSVLTGITPTQLGISGASKSGVSNNYSYTLNETGIATNIWDLIISDYVEPVVVPIGPSVANTNQSLANTASALQGTYTLQNSVLSNSFTYDCTVFGANDVCVSAGGRNTQVQAANGLNNTSALLIAAYRPHPNYRIGAYADQNLSVSNPGGTVNLGNNTPLIGLFGAWNQRLDGTGTEVKVSAAYGQKNTTMTRSVVGSGTGASEAGSGSSTLNSQGVQVTAKYGFGIMDKVIVSPYVGVRYTSNTMGGYSEQATSSVTAPLTYSALNTNATTALAGVGASYKVIPTVMTFASAGVETDTNTANGTYSATNASIGTLTPVNFNANPVKTRPTATVGAYYDIEKNQRLGITGIYRQEAYQAVSTTTVMATYTIGL